jgi:UDP-N-acetyl-D-mannosaminuronic acid dehydrogenase
VNRVPERQLHQPGPGVGGHCIPKDPFLFMAGSTHESHVVRAAHASNSAMPIKFCERVDAFFAELNESSRTVCLLGYSYLANSGDTRNSPSSAILVELLRRGYTVHVHDPFVTEYSDKLDEKIRNSHLSVILVNHSVYDAIPESRALRFADFMGF